MKRLLMAFCTLAVLAGPVAAADSGDARHEAAQRYAATFDFQSMLGQTINQMAQTLPAEQRSGFIQAMNESIDLARLEELSIGLMEGLFTADELNALAEFYETSTGQSILKKMPQLMSGLMPIMQDQMVRTIERAQKRQQEQPNKGSRL